MDNGQQWPETPQTVRQQGRSNEKTTINLAELGCRHAHCVDGGVRTDNIEVPSSQRGNFEPQTWRGVAILETEQGIQKRGGCLCDLLKPGIIRALS